jgi:hypothetical protein
MEDKKIEAPEAAGKTRRAFVKTAAQVAVTAPVAAMILSASTKQAAAAITAYASGDTDTQAADWCWHDHGADTTDCGPGSGGLYDNTSNGTPGPGGTINFDDIAIQGDTK